MHLGRTLLVLFCLISSVAWGQANDTRSLWTYNFEDGGLSGWNSTGNVRIDHTTGHNGKNGVVITTTKVAGGEIYRGIGLPERKDVRPRLFRFSFYVKSQNMAKDGLSISLLKQFNSGREAEWFEPLSPTFMTVPHSSQWTKVQGQGIVGPEVKELTIYIRAAGGVDGGQVWLDEITGELLDRGILFVSGKESNIYTSDEGTMDLVISGAQKIASGNVSLLDEADRVKATIEIKRGLEKIAIPLASRGFYRIKSTTSYDDGVQCEAETVAAVVGSLIDDSERMKSRFGMSGYGFPFVAAGARWDRRCMGLDRDFLKKAAETNFTQDLPSPAYEVSEDMTSIYCLWPQPVWLQDRTDAVTGNPFDMYPMKDWETFRKLIAYYVRNMSKKPVEYIEVSNEPDGWKGSWSDLVKYHQVMGEAAKSVNPNVKILGPSLCTIKISEIKVLAKLGLFKAIDGFAIHAYVRSTPPEQEFIQYVRDLKAYLASIGKKDMPIFFTEYGWPVPPGDWQKPVDPLTQAQYCSRSLILLAAAEIDCIQWFCMRWADPSSGAYGYGLLNWDWTPRPSYSAYANATRCLTGTTGPGRTFQLTPTTYMTLFRKGTGTLAAIWDTQDETSVVIPKPWTLARDMMGGTIRGDNEAGKITVGRSPIFIELADSQFYDMKEVKNVTVRQDGTVVLPWEPVWAPGNFQGSGVKRRVPKDASKGPYLAFGKVQNQWQAVAVKVNVPLEITSADVFWAAGQSEPVLRVKVCSELSRPTVLTGKVKLKDAAKIAQPNFTVEQKTCAESTIPLANLKPGKRYRGEYIVEPARDGKYPRATFPLDITMVPCLSVADASNLSNLPVMDITPWRSFTATLDPLEIAPSDCSATMQVGYNDQGLIMKVVVRDSVHRQVQGPRSMWMEDSLQLAFDMDRDQPWKPNQGGCNGHFRVFEYGVALGEKSPMAWRWISYYDGLPRDVEEKRVVANVNRSGETTVYNLVFPWSTLGLDRKPAPGSTIGFALAVNDFDGSPSGRKGLMFFRGIVDQKDPAVYGKLWVR